MSKYIQIITTVAKKKEAQKIINILLTEKLIACGQIIGPIESYYRWQGKLEANKEYLCLLKSREDKLDLIKEKIEANHSYDLPEIIVTPIIAGGSKYLAWLEKETT